MDRATFFMLHSVYLKSPKWASKRKEKLKAANYICEICKTSPATQIHHLTYQNWQNEKLDDLQALCNVCHEKYHPGRILSDDERYELRMEDEYEKEIQQEDYLANYLE